MSVRWPVTRYAITGATGTLGKAIIRRLLADGSAERIAAISRDEVKQGDLGDEFGADGPVRCMLGDVRDAERMAETFRGCQAVIHAAALKRVQAVAYSPHEAIKTNVQGTVNVIRAALAAGVGRVVMVSSDKAVEPINHYGTTKAAAETYAVQANAVTWPAGTRVAAVRYGNVLGSRGSVLGVWARQVDEGRPLTLTSPAMTRFLITPEQAVQFVLDAVYDLQGGEVFVPRLPACTIGELAEAFAPSPDYPVLNVGLRPGGEKLHETLLNQEERRFRLRLRDGRYVVTPSHREWTDESYLGEALVLPVPYDSEHAPKLTVDELRKILEAV